MLNRSYARTHVREHSHSSKSRVCKSTVPFPLSLKVVSLNVVSLNVVSLKISEDESIMSAAYFFFICLRQTSPRRPPPASQLLHGRSHFKELACCIYSMEMINSTKRVRRATLGPHDTDVSQRLKRRKLLQRSTFLSVQGVGHAAKTNDVYQIVSALGRC